MIILKDMKLPNIVERNEKKTCFTPRWPPSEVPTLRLFFLTQAPLEPLLSQLLS